MSSTCRKQSESACPICDKQFSITDIEAHVNKCIFLNSSSHDSDETIPKTPPTKRPVSPTLNSGYNCSPKISRKTLNLSSPPPPSLPQNSKDSKNFQVPLAMQVQPITLDTFFGQSHVLGPNTVLRSMLEKADIPNMILWGPPGCGKTSLSAIVRNICRENATRWHFATFCAAISGVKEVQTVVKEAKNRLKFGQRTVLFMDEIHRFNKQQQDIFLLHVEKGDIVLIGATTENPSFRINSALLSRCRVVVFEKLDETSLYQILEKAARHLGFNVVLSTTSLHLYSNERNSTISQEALKWLADVSDGDARIALNNLQLVQQTNQENTVINIDNIQETLKKSHMLYDRKGEEHYNTISAMHKSIRGSDPNAALYWTARMIVSGEDPLYIARRMVRAASEDIGNADPQALQLAVATMQGCQMLGMPECDCLLAQCAIYLARAPKSREADSALANAKQVIQQCRGVQPPVPMHIRNAPTRLMRELGYGKQSNDNSGFMPPQLQNTNFFE